MTRRLINNDNCWRYDGKCMTTHRLRNILKEKNSKFEMNNSCNSDLYYYSAKEVSDAQTLFFMILASFYVLSVYV